MAAQDPGELFDLCDERGVPLGRSKARALVHRDGDWHRSLHVWVALLGGAAGAGEAGGVGEARVLFQRRSAGKDTWPGRIDVAVTGHFRAGESARDALREADEEVGLPLGVDDVVRLGTRRRVHAAPGVLDREVQEIYVAVTGRGLAALRAQEDEVAGLIALPIGEARAVLVGGAERARGEELGAGAGAGAGVRACEVGHGEFIPDGDGYYARALAGVEAVLRGERPAVWWVPEG